MRLRTGMPPSVSSDINLSREQDFGIVTRPIFRGSVLEDHVLLSLRLCKARGGWGLDARS